MNPYSRLIPRLNGREIEERFGDYLELVKKGVAGFIIFGGEIETVRARVRELQTAAPRPLIIASDLEQGLGQQIQEGTRRLHWQECSCYFIIRLTIHPH